MNNIQTKYIVFILGIYHSKDDSDPLTGRSQEPGFFNSAVDFTLYTSVKCFIIFQRNLHLIPLISSN